MIEQTRNIARLDEELGELLYEGPLCALSATLDNPQLLGQLEDLQNLVDRGASIFGHYRDRTMMQNALLSGAYSTHHAAQVEFLFKNGYPPSGQANEEAPILFIVHIALRENQDLLGHSEIGRDLLEVLHQYGSDVFARDDSGDTALDLLLRRNEAEQVLPSLTDRGFFVGTVRRLALDIVEFALLNGKQEDALRVLYKDEFAQNDLAREIHEVLLAVGGGDADVSHVDDPNTRFEVCSFSWRERNV